jgi:hypothetical protein
MLGSLELENIMCGQEPLAYAMSIIIQECKGNLIVGRQTTLKSHMLVGAFYASRKRS